MNRIWIALILVAAVAATVVGAQTVDPPTQGVSVELAELNVTLQEIKQVLAEQLETDSLDLLLKRTELVSADAARLEAQLRDSQAQRQSLQDNEEQFRAQIEGIELELRNSGAEQIEEYESYARQMTMELDRTQRRIQTLDGEIQSLQNRLTAKQRDLASWQDLVDRRLGGV